MNDTTTNMPAVPPGGWPPGPGPGDADPGREEELLRRAVESYAYAEGCRTSHYLECGEAIQQLLELRCARGDRRADVLRDVRLRIRQEVGAATDVHNLLQGWHVHRLLGGGDVPAGLPWSGIKVLTPLVQRVEPGDPECNAWHVNPCVSAEGAVALYREWVTSAPRMTVSALKREVDRLMGRAAEAPRGTDNADAELAADDPNKPRLVAEQFAGVIRRHQDPDAVLFDLVVALREDFRPSHAEAIAAGLAECGLELSLARLRDACAAALRKLGARREDRVA